MFFKKKIKLSAEQWLGLTILINLYKDCTNKPDEKSYLIEEMLSLVNHVDIEQLKKLLFQNSNRIYKYATFNTFDECELKSVETRF